MNDFTAISKANESDDLKIENNGFFPDIYIKQVRNAQLLDGTVTTERLKNAVINAILSVNKDLADWRLAQQAENIKKLENLTQDAINGESKYLILYKKAVYNLANALLIEQYFNYDATAKSKKQLDPEINNAGTFYREARNAVRDILDVSRTTVTLI